MDNERLLEREVPDGPDSKLDLEELQVEEVDDLPGGDLVVELSGEHGVLG